MVVGIIAGLEFILVILLIVYILSNITFKYYNATIISKRKIVNKSSKRTTTKYLIDVVSYGNNDSKKIYTLEVDYTAYENACYDQNILIKL